MGQSACSDGVAAFGLFRKNRFPYAARPLFLRTRWPVSAAAESGFSLIGMLATLVIAVIVTAAAVYYLNLSNTRGEAIYQTMNAIVRASQNFAQDTGCYPSNVVDLETQGINGVGGPIDCLGGYKANIDQWDGPYITPSRVFPGGNIHIAASDSGMHDTMAYLAVGDWLSQNPEMAGRGKEEVAVMIGPVSASTQAEVCKRCNGCAEQGNNLPSTCFVTNVDGRGLTVGKVFASVG